MPVDDNIPGDDRVVQRDNVDFTVHKYGKLFCDFHIGNICKILNGRNFTSNDFTYIGSHGSSM